MKTLLGVVALFGCLLSGDPGAARNCTPRSECCKICDVGQACGKTCINANYTCHVGRGCACNRSEVCPQWPAVSPDDWLPL